MQRSRIAATILPATLIAALFAGAAGAQTMTAPDPAQDMAQHQAAVATKSREAAQDDRQHNTSVNNAQAKRDHMASLRANANGRMQDHRQRQAGVPDKANERSPDEPTISPK